MKRFVSCLAILFVAWSTNTLLLLLLSLPSLSWGASLEDEYVRQVIEEDQQYYYDEYHEDDETVHRQAQVDEQRRKEAEERAAREAADRVAAERERRFQAEMDRINDEDEKKKVLKQKKMDGKKVRSVLKAFENNNLYKVLGIRNWSLKIPPRTVRVGGLFQFTVPGITLLQEASEKKIRKQYRKRAVEVHPDKNRDGRAKEAFVAVEEAAGILGNAKLREEYDRERALRRKEQMILVRTTVDYGWAITKRTFKVVHTLLGPFFIPVVILLALII